MSIEASDAAVAEALAQAVRAAGRDLATEPRRVQGMVTDVLGVDARTRRAEVDAVVLAAEESIPEELLTEQLDDTGAIERLRDRGLGDEVATFAVAVWRYALGMLPDDAPAPTLTDSLENTALPGITDPAAGESVGGTVFDPPIAGPTVLPPVDVAAEADDHDDTASTRRTPLWIGLGTAAALALAIVLIVALLPNGDDDSTSEQTTSVSPTTSVPPTTSVTGTTSLPTTTVTVDPEASIAQGDALAEQIFENGYSSVYILARNDDDGVAEATSTNLENGGAIVLGTTMFDPSAADYRAEVGAAKAAAPEAIVIIGSDETSRIMSEMVAQGIGPDKVGIFGTNMP